MEQGGRRYHVMAKLDPVKISWIIRQTERGTCNKEIVHSMKVSVRWTQKLYSVYRSTRVIPVLKQPGRPKRQITEQETSIVVSAFEKYRCCTVFLEKTIDACGIHIPHNTIHKILKSEKLASELAASSQYATLNWNIPARIVPTFSFYSSLVDDGRYLICYEDDASRFITGYGIFSNATSENAVKVLKVVIKNHGRPASVLTDHGSQFYANESEYKTNGATEFEKTLVQLGIKHISWQ